MLALLLVFAALGPAKWQFRTGMGWQFDHVIGYLGFTVMFCLAWPRAFVVGGILTACAFMLEALQAFTPDRSCDFRAAPYSASGALGGALIGHLFILVRMQLLGTLADLAAVAQFCARALLPAAAFARAYVVNRTVSSRRPF
jgi:hypothetical protein